MSCPKCGSELPSGSSFCNKCGASLGGAPPLSAPAGPPSQDPETELWRGRFSGRAHAHRWLLWALGVGALAAAFLKAVPPAYQSRLDVRYAFLGAALLPLLGIVMGTLRMKASVRYRLTTHRLFTETGLLSRDTNEIELVRVDDVSVHQNLLQRLFNVGTVTVFSPHDQTDPRLEMRGIENPIEVKEQIRTHVRRRRQGSLNVENL